MLFGRRKREPSFSSFSLYITSDRRIPGADKSLTRVGLGIVAAMSDGQEDSGTNPEKRIFMAPMLFSATKRKRAVDVDPLSESYTCISFHLGNNVIKKRVYFDDELIESDKEDEPEADVRRRRHGRRPSIFEVACLEESEEELGKLRSGQFLDCCRLCDKKLNGKDIFMYRGYITFCTPECRDEYMEKDGSKDLLGPEPVPTTGPASAAS